MSGSLSVRSWNSSVWTHELLWPCEPLWTCSCGYRGSIRDDDDHDPTDLASLSKRLVSRHVFVLNPGESNADADTLNQEVCFRTPPYSNTLTFKLPVRFRIRLLFWRRPPHSEIVRVSVGVKRRVRSEVRPYTPICRCCLNLKEALIYCQYNNVLSIIKPSELIDHMN